MSDKKYDKQLFADISAVTMFKRMHALEIILENP